MKYYGPPMRTLETSCIKLRFVPLASLLLHEEHDPYRVKRTISTLTEEGILRDPPIVAEHGDRYVVLDGATRITALREMCFRDVLVQIVDYDSDTVDLSVWHHVVVSLNSDRLLADLTNLDQLVIKPVDAGTAHKMLDAREIAACIVMRDGQEFAVLGQGDINNQTNLICRLVAVYRGKAEVHRSIKVDLNTQIGQYPDLSAVISFPRFRPAELIQIAVNGYKLPMGVSRHIIAGRVLRVNVPLERLTNSQPLTAKNAWMDDQIHQRLKTDKIRLYQEPVFIFDE